MTLAPDIHELVAEIDAIEAVPVPVAPPPPSPPNVESLVESVYSTIYEGRWPQADLDALRVASLADPTVESRVVAELNRASHGHHFSSIAAQVLGTIFPSLRPAPAAAYLWADCCTPGRGRLFNGDVPEGRITW